MSSWCHEFPKWEVCAVHPRIWYVSRQKSKASWEAVTGMCSFSHYSVPFWHGADKGEGTDRHRNRIQYVAICFLSTAESHALMCLAVWENPQLPQT